MTLLLEIGIPFLILLFSYQRIAAFRRGRRVAAWARRRGWDHQRKADAALAEPYGFPFDKGGRRRVTDVVRGNYAGTDALCFTFRHRFHRSTRYYGAYVLPLPHELPGTVQVKPMLDLWLGTPLALHLVQFESDEFNQRYAVYTDRPKLASDVVTPQLMAWLLDSRGRNFRLTPTHAVLVHPYGLRPDQIETHLAYLGGIVDRLPAFLWDAH